MDAEVRTTDFVRPGFSLTFCLTLTFGRRPVLLFAQIGRRMLCALYSWGRDEKIPRESFFFLVELEDSGAPAAPVLN